MHPCLRLEMSTLKQHDSIINDIHKEFSLKIGQLALETELDSGSNTSVETVLQLMKCFNPDFTYAEYKFIPQQKNHVFTVGARPISKHKVNNLISNCKLGAINYNLLKCDFFEFITIVVNWNLTPVKPKFLIHGEVSDIFKGSSLIKDTYAKRKSGEVSHFYCLPTTALDNMISISINTLFEDIKWYWNREELTPYTANHIGVNMLNMVHALLVAVTARYNLPKIAMVGLNRDMLLEGIESKRLHYGTDIPRMCGILIYVVGELIERVADQGYSHLFKGYVSNGK